MYRRAFWVGVSLKKNRHDEIGGHGAKQLSKSFETQHDARAQPPVSPSGVLTFRELFAVATLAISSQAFTNVYPDFIGALASAGRATPTQLGWLVTDEYTFLALAAMLAGRVLKLRHLRRLAVFAALLEIAAVVGTTQVSGVHLLPVRAVFATACGVHMWLLYEYVARAANPGRLVGICTTVVVTVSMAFSWIASNQVAPRFGANGVILFFGLPSVAAILGASLLPRGIADPVSTTAKQAVSSTSWSDKISPSAFWILLSATCWSAWISVLWVFSEAFSKTIGISETASRVFVLTSLAGSLAGAGLGATVVDKLPAARVLSIGLLLGMAQVVAFLTGVGSVAFVAWFSLFGFLGYFLVPFFVKELAAAGRHSVIYFPAAQYGGAALGPLIASFVVAPGQYRAGILVDLGAIVFAIATFWIGLFLQRSRALDTT
jgi:hypothetical protein